MNTVLEVRGLVNRFGTNLVHDGLDIDLRRGEILGVVGGSGTGKSVLLRSIVGLKRPDGGKISVLGVDVLSADFSAREALGRRWGVMFQDGALFSALTLRENVEVPLRSVAGLTPQIREALAELKLALAGLEVASGSLYPAELSGGMRKRAGLARALALDPEILFLDEPTAGLDPIAASAFDRMIVDLRDALGLSVFLVTHDLDTLHACCDRVAVLAERRVIASGAPGEMMQVDHPWVQSYFGGPRGLRALAARQG